MIISEEQVRRAVEYLQTSKASPSASGSEAVPADVSPELLDRVRRTLADLPELRDDRVAQGRALLDQPPVSGNDVAEKMIGRIISDSIR